MNEKEADELILNPQGYVEDKLYELYRLYIPFAAKVTKDQK
jgi:hypothetical protein